MSNNAILNSVIKLRYGEIALQPTKDLVEFLYQSQKQRDIITL